MSGPGRHSRDPDEPAKAGLKHPCDADGFPFEDHPNGCLSFFRRLRSADGSDVVGAATGPFPARRGRMGPDRTFIRSITRLDGLQRNLIEEFDPGSARTLAAWLKHASRAVKAPSGVYKAANGRVMRS